MTHHVRDSYRHHRKATWGIVTVLVVAIAAVVIPLANAAEKTFTLTVSPTSMCTSATDGGASTVLTLKNTGSPQTMGSAEVYFPSGTVHQASSGTLLSSTTSTTSGGTKDIIRFNNLGLAPGQSKVVTVSFKASANFSTAITAVVKQANNFNDSGGGANLFTVQGSFPTLRVVQCVTVEGRVFLDRNQDGFYSTSSQNGDIGVISDLPKAWTVSLYQGSETAAFRTTTSSATTGLYQLLQVPVGSNYRICVAAALVADTSAAWALRVPTGNTQCGKLSPTSDPTSAAKLLAPLTSTTAVGHDFGLVPVTAPFGPGNTSTVTGYSVTAGTNPGKADQRYVQETWVDANGRTNFRFAPVTPCTGCGTIYLLEELEAFVALTALDGDQARLLYDDDPSFYEVHLQEMPYCLVDPQAGQPSGSLATSGVLPGSDTSCIVTGSQAVIAGGKVKVQYRVYTSFDGGRQIG
jgi:hypothetical protein